MSFEGESFVCEALAGFDESVQRRCVRDMVGFAARAARMADLEATGVRVAPAWRPPLSAQIGDESRRRDVAGEVTAWAWEAWAASVRLSELCRAMEVDCW